MLMREPYRKIQYQNCFNTISIDSFALNIEDTCNKNLTFSKY